MATNDLQKTFEKFQREVAEARKRFQEKKQKMFKETFKQFFENNPAVTAVKWTQYTPFYNDGDPCKFRVNDPIFTNASEDDMDNVSVWGEYEGENESVWVAYFYEIKKLNVDGLNVADAELLIEMMCSTKMEDIVENLFGDHVQVTATREGFDVHDYDHD